MHDVYPPDHWAIAGHAAGLRHARRGRLSHRPQRHAAGQGRVVAARPMPGASRSGRWPAIRSPMRRRPSSRRWPKRCRAAWRTRSTIATPFSTLQKHQVIELGARLGVPFELTLSCMSPTASAHCGGAASAASAATRSPKRACSTRAPTRSPSPARRPAGRAGATDSNRIVPSPVRTAQRAAAGTERGLELAPRSIVVVVVGAFGTASPG